MGLYLGGVLRLGYLYVLGRSLRSPLPLSQTLSILGPPSLLPVGDPICLRATEGLESPPLGMEGKLGCGSSL